MRRALALVAGVVLFLAAPGPPAGAQGTPGGERSQRGPDALWDAFPLQDRPSPAEAEREAAPDTRDAVVFVERRAADGPSPLYSAVGVCLGAGILLLGAGLLRARPWTARQRRPPANTPEISS